MTKREYTQKFKEQIIKECQEVGNIALVARRHNISPNTIQTWVRKIKQTGSLNPLPKNSKKRRQEIEKRLEDISRENNELKKLLGEKELELAVLRDMRDKINPQ
ncbi:transposase [Thermosyntropha sp.]|uniref:transposase n=1 Tax=Thermosyntropha sp. TaxID=2740820 RepID=UPI0025F0042D|nr:transposase [Thermosyntropha sp.]MBO8159466.1 transposase [Thermosyntropha sp.]